MLHALWKYSDETEIRITIQICILHAPLLFSQYTYYKITFLKQYEVLWKFISNLYYISTTVAKLYERLTKTFFNFAHSDMNETIDRQIILMESTFCEKVFWTNLASDASLKLVPLSSVVQLSLNNGNHQMNQKCKRCILMSP